MTQLDQLTEELIQDLAEQMPHSAGCRAHGSECICQRRRVSAAFFLLPVVLAYGERRALIERNRTLADARAIVERETDAYPGASPAITSGIWGGFDQWAMSEYGTLADPDRRLCGKCGIRHTQHEYDDAHRNDEGGY